MVSTIICPRCKTKNAKTAEICYNCKNTLKTHKKPSILSTNPKSKIELKLIVVGTIIFVVTNIILLDIAFDYAYMISGFSTMVYLYFAFKNSPIPKSDNNLRRVGFKIILNYLIIVLLGCIFLLATGIIQWKILKIKKFIFILTKHVKPGHPNSLVNRSGHPFIYTHFTC